MVQIAFVTLFLGLTVGSQPLELTVSGPVAAVELLLDGHPAGRLQGPPWTGQIDLGSRLEPHQLVARALDDQGQEVGQASQWINLPRPPAEVEILLERGSDGRVSGARVAWQSLTGAKPASIGVAFNGQPLEVDRTGHVRIPQHDPETSHILTAELLFPGAVTARKDTVFGGKYGEEVSTELTGVPVRLRAGKRLPPVQQLQGWFLADGKPLPVAAIEQGPAQLLVVRDRAAIGPLRSLDRGGPSKSVESASARRRFQMTLESQDEVQIVWPSPATYPGAGGVRADLFVRTRGYTAKEGGLFWILSRLLPLRNDQEAQRQPQHFADAVAVAGLGAMDGNRRRAVLLVLAGGADGSRTDPVLVRHYLEQIRVPLYVWSVSGTSGPAELAWGSVEDVSSFPKLTSAFQKIEEDLKSQTLIWVDGRHLPQSITLSPAAAEVVELLGS